MFSALVRNGQLIAAIPYVPSGDAEYAFDVTIDGTPVNVKSAKISNAKKWDKFLEREENFGIAGKKGIYIIE